MKSSQAEILDNGASVLDALRLRLAAQLAPRQWAPVLRRVADKVDSGQPLEEAARQCSLSKELAALFSSALQVPQPTTFLLEALRSREQVRGNWRAFIGLVSYPLALLLAATLVGTLFSLSVRGLVDFSELENFGFAGIAEARARIDDQHAALAGAAMSVGWIAIILMTVAVLGPPWAWSAVVGGIPIFGRPLRWVSLQEILQRYDLFARQGLVDSSLGWRVADSFTNSSQAVAARAIAERIAEGTPLGQSFSMSMHSDGLCRPALHLLDEQNSGDHRAFDRVANLLGQLVAQRCRAIGLLIPVFLLAIVGTVLWATISCYFMVLFPLITLITSLA